MTFDDWMNQNDSTIRDTEWCRRLWDASGAEVERLETETARLRHVLMDRMVMARRGGSQVKVDVAARVHPVGHRSDVLHEARAMRHLDLFSGIGGFALAASWVWPGHEVVAFCEIDAYCRRVLGKHWPDAPIIPDIHDLDGSAYADVDILTGGFPCQPFSVAGKQQGAADDRHLWPQMLRVIREVRPRYVVAENVPGLLAIDDGVQFETVLSDLEDAGYQVQPLVIPAVGVGAPHRRYRIWIVAHTDIAGPQGRVGASLCERSDERTPGPGGTPHVAHAEINVAPEPFASWDGRGGLDDERICRGQWLNPDHWSTEPDVGRVADGVPKRVDRLKGLGNAIVPQVAEAIFRAINATDPA